MKLMFSLFPNLLLYLSKLLIFAFVTPPIIPIHVLTRPHSLSLTKNLLLLENAASSKRNDAEPLVQPLQTSPLIFLSIPSMLRVPSHSTNASSGSPIVPFYFSSAPSLTRISTPLCHENTVPSIVSVCDVIQQALPTQCPNLLNSTVSSTRRPHSTPLLQTQLLLRSSRLLYPNTNQGPQLYSDQEQVTASNRLDPTPLWHCQNMAHTLGMLKGGRWCIVRLGGNLGWNQK